jgi:hypothetical protein
MDSALPRPHRRPLAHEIRLVLAVKLLLLGLLWFLFFRTPPTPTAADVAAAVIAPSAKVNAAAPGRSQLLP